MVCREDRQRLRYDAYRPFGGENCSAVLGECLTDADPLPDVSESEPALLR
jgi:hypothetical protein